MREYTDMISPRWKWTMEQSVYLLSTVVVRTLHDEPYLPDDRAIV